MFESYGEKRTDFSQDHLLHQLWKNKLSCTIITTNGVPIKGKIESFDKFVVLVRLPSQKQSMVYKHAVSTILADL